MTQTKTSPERRFRKFLNNLPRAVQRIQNVEEWLAGEVEAGDKSLRVHRDDLRRALRDLGVYEGGGR